MMAVTPLLEIVPAVQSDPGCCRQDNEDCGRVFVPRDPAMLSTKGILVPVADGMGGHQAGEVASHLAVDSIGRSYYSARRDPAASLFAAFKIANEAICARASETETLQGMGTTCCGLVLLNNRAFAAYVGDTRIYLVRDARLYVMTQDHSAVMEQVKQGAITLIEARNHQDRNVVLRVLGRRPLVEIGHWKQSFPIKPRDRFVVCSDGLYDMVSDEEMYALISRLAPHDAVTALIELARQRGGHDNITVAVIGVESDRAGSGRELPITRESELPQ